MKNLLILFSFLLFFAFSCRKDKEDKSNTPPTIELLSTSPLEVLQFDSLVTIYLKYSDEEGDIGENDADMRSLEIKDARLTVPDYYHIPPQTPYYQELNIEGTIKINPTALFILGNSEQEVTTYTIRLQDRAGNWSNEITTPSIVIKDSI